MFANIREPESSVPIVGQVDVVVAGGGLAGFAAAIRACDNGLRTAIIEERGSLGREAWAALQVFPRLDAGVPLPRIGDEILARLGP